MQKNYHWVVEFLSKMKMLLGMDAGDQDGCFSFSTPKFDHAPALQDSVRHQSLDLEALASFHGKDHWIWEVLKLNKIWWKDVGARTRLHRDMLPQRLHGMMI